MHLLKKNKVKIKRQKNSNQNDSRISYGIIQNCYTKLKVNYSLNLNFDNTVFSSALIAFNESALIFTSEAALLISDET